LLEFLPGINLNVRKVFASVGAYRDTEPHVLIVTRRQGPMSNHLTPSELAKEAGMDRRDVISKCLELGVPIFHGKIDKSLFAGTLQQSIALQSA
jgi:hypothetical protein